MLKYISVTFTLTHCLPPFPEDKTKKKKKAIVLPNLIWDGRKKASSGFTVSSDLGPQSSELVHSSYVLPQCVASREGQITPHDRHGFETHG